MRFAVTAIAGLLSMIGVSVNAIVDSNRAYKEEFEQIFQIQTVKKTGLGVDDPWQPNGGNAIKMTKDNKAILVTHRDGSLSFLDPKTEGNQGSPDSASLYPALNAAQLINDKHGTDVKYVECRSGIVLSPDGADENLIVYAVIEGVAALGQEPLHTAIVDPTKSQSYLIFVKVPDDFGAAGSTLEVTVSDPLPGDATGTPVLSYDAKYAYITSNKKLSGSDQNSTSASQYDEGYLNVIDTSSGGVDYQFPVNTPVSEAGIFHQPEEQYFGGGEDANKNDIVVFIERPACRECSVDTPEQGELFVFAFKGPSANPIDPEKILSLGIKPFKGYMAPVIYNDGYSMLLPTTAHGIRLWDEQKFSENPDIRTPAGQPLRRAQRFEYPDPAGVTVLNDPTPASPLYIEDGDEKFVYSNFGRHDVAIAKMQASDLSILWYIPTETGTADFRSFAISRPVLTPDNEYILWTESGTGANGRLHMVHASNGTSAMDSAMIPDVTTADIALSNDGTVVYAIGDYGLLRAYKIADLLNTDTPTATPTRSPTTEAPVPTTDAPTGAPTSASTDAESTPTDDSPTKNYGKCEGECKDDNDCEGDLICYDLADDEENIHGCATSILRSYEAICVQVIPSGDEPTPAPSTATNTEKTDAPSSSAPSQKLLAYASAGFAVALSILFV